MSELVRYAERELALAGLDRPDSDYDGMLAKDVVDLIRVFADQGHSGHSAAMTVHILQKLMRFRPLTPLTGSDDEWVEVGNGIYQNKRCSSVFKQADRLEGQAYDIDAGQDELRPISFPYTPS